MVADIIKKIIENARKDNILFTKHCTQKLLDRNLSKNEIIQKLKTKPIGILEQDKNTFKLIYPYNDRYNLSIIVKTNDNIQIITAFIHLAGRYL